MFGKRNALGQFISGPPPNTTHGQSGVQRSPAYHSWHAMKQRCLNVKHSGYKDYGAKDITVCERWRTFSLFYEDMGDRPANTTLDRINNAFGYEPGNCRWATDAEQHANQAHNGTPKQTHCKQGHELTEENSLWTKSTRGYRERQCRTCARNRTQAYRQAKKLVLA